MRLKNIISTLMQSEFGEQINDRMMVSVPLPPSDWKGKIFDCFAYMYSRKSETYSAPVAKIRFDAENRLLLRYVSCEEEPFSSNPLDLFSSEFSSDNRIKRYQEFERIYDLSLPLFYKEYCSDEEKKCLLAFIDAFEKFAEPFQMTFYKELVPEFFFWIKGQISSLKGDIYG